MRLNAEPKLIPGETASDLALEILDAIAEEAELNSLIAFATKNINRL